MKKTTNYLAAILISLSLFTACAEAPDSDKAKVEEAKPVEKKANIANLAEGVKVSQVDLKNSSVGWIGTKPTGKHEGIFNLKSGRITTKDNKLVGGEFIIDIKSLTVTDLQGEMGANLRGHLISDDFFKASKYPTGKFTITGVQVIKDADKDKTKFKGATHNVQGNLELLGVSKSIQFPARVFLNKDKFQAEADFNINRTDWGISYGNDQSLGDKFIKPEVNIKLDIKS